MSDPLGLNPRHVSGPTHRQTGVRPAGGSGCDQQFLNDRESTAALYSPLPFDLTLARSNHESRRAESDRVEFSFHLIATSARVRRVACARASSLDVTA